MTENKKKLKISKMYRLFDCNFYDHKDEKNDASSDEDDKPKSDIPKFIVELYGINETGETACIKVNNYKPFFYIKVGDDWTSMNIGPFKAWFMQKLGAYHSKSVINLELVSKKKLYGFTHGKESKFIKMFIRLLEYIENIIQEQQAENNLVIDVSDIENSEGSEDIEDALVQESRAKM